MHWEELQLYDHILHTLFPGLSRCGSLPYQYSHIILYAFVFDPLCLSGRRSQHEHFVSSSHTLSLDKPGKPQNLLVNQALKRAKVSRRGS